MHLNRHFLLIYKKTSCQSCQNVIKIVPEQAKSVMFFDIFFRSPTVRQLISLIACNMNTKEFYMD